MATLAIGDIHGERGALLGLLSVVREEVGRGDVVVFLGDYIDRGSDSRGCIEAILEFRSASAATVVCLRGNHEDWLLATHHDFTRHSWLLGMDGLDTVRSYSLAAARILDQARREAGPRLYTERIRLPYDAFFSAMPASHLAFFSELRLSYMTDDCLCSHAGVDPRLTLTEQTAWSFTFGDASFPAKYRGSTPIVYGHWNDAVLDEQGWPTPNMGSHTIGIDTIAHGVLTAVRLPGRQVFQSPGRRS
jgi:serine/threonine protein phosphatase 1